MPANIERTFNKSFSDLFIFIKHNFFIVKSRCNYFETFLSNSAFYSSNATSTWRPSRRPPSTTGRRNFDNRDIRPPAPANGRPRIWAQEPWSLDVAPCVCGPGSGGIRKFDRLWICAGSSPSYSCLIAASGVIFFCGSQSSEPKSVEDGLGTGLFEELGQEAGAEQRLMMRGAGNMQGRGICLLGSLWVSRLRDRVGDEVAWRRKFGFERSRHRFRGFWEAGVGNRGVRVLAWFLESRNWRDFFVLLVGRSQIARDRVYLQEGEVVEVWYDVIAKVGSGGAPAASQYRKF